MILLKKIAASLNADITEDDISKAYRLKKQEDKIIVEFSSLKKKSELMEKIERPRVDAKTINDENNTEGNNSNNNNSKYLYINDQLTFNNRQLIWLAKTKAKECNCQ